MTIDNLRLVRNILLRSFIVGTLIYLFSVIATYSAWDTWVSLTSKWYHADEPTLSRLVLDFFVNCKFFLTFILLVPALGIHWTIKTEESSKTS